MANTEDAASGLLGSTLLSKIESQSDTTPESISSGCPEIDDQALAGGFRYGEIASIAGASGTGKTAFTFHAIASHLFQNPHSEAAIVDTKGNFSPVHLRDILAARLRNQHRQDQFKQSGYIYEQNLKNRYTSDESLSDQATTMLERVKVMRVFELAGLVEAISEVGEICEAAKRKIDEQIEAHKRAKKNTIADSEDESEDELSQTLGDPMVSSDFRKSADMQAARLLVVDSVSNIVGPIISKSQAQGQALLTSLMRSLHHLSVKFAICTIVTNSVVGVHPSANPQYHRRPEDNVSIFASIMGKPALGKTFAYLVDISILLSSLPKTREDAEAAYGGDNESKDFASAGIFEVLKDRRGVQAGRWTAFDIIRGIDIKSIHLQS